MNKRIATMIVAVLLAIGVAGTVNLPAFAAQPGANTTKNHRLSDKHQKKAHHRKAVAIGTATRTIVAKNHGLVNKHRSHRK